MVLVFLIGVGFYKLKFEMAKVSIKSFEEREFFHGFPEVIKHLSLGVKMSNTTEHVVVSLRYFGIVVEI